MTRSARFAALVVVFVPLLASAEPELLGLSIRARAQVGGPGPALILQPQVGVKSVRVTLVAGSGKKKSLKASKVRRGQQKVLEWKQPEGRESFEATFDVKWAKGGAEQFTLTFQTEVYPKLRSTITKQDVDLEGRRLSLRLNQPAARVDLTVWGDDGAVMHRETFEQANAPPNEPIEVSWEQPDGAVVLKIEAKAHSEMGFWVATEIYPYEVEIPHVDVVFDTGSAQIKDAEAPKLEDAAKQVADKLRKYGNLVELQLYVAGFTDTVGGAASNQALSEKRARAIGTWFRKHGLKLPMFYQGFGERNPAVETPDETPEAKNRRAVYTLSAGRPQRLSSGWKPL